MPNPNSSLVLAGTGAGGATGLELLWVAPTGTTAPTNAHTALPAVNAAWSGMGYVSSDGVTIGRDESSNDITAYGSGAPVRTVNTSSKSTFQVVCLETNEAVLEVYHRLDIGTIIPDADGDFTLTEGTVPVQRYSFCLDVVDDTNYIRYYYASAEVTEVQEQKIGNGEAIQYGFTITAYPNSTTGIAVSKFYRVPALAGS